MHCTAPNRAADLVPRVFSDEAACRTMRATRMIDRHPRRLRSLAVLAVAAVGATLAVAVATGAVSVTGTVSTSADEGHQVVPAGSRAFFLHGTATGLRNSVSMFATPDGAATTVTDATAIGDPQFGAVAGGRLYLANQSPLGGAFRIGVLDAATGATAGTVAIPTSSMPKFIAATPNGATVVAFNDWESAFADPTISVMAIAAGATTGTSIPIGVSTDRMVMGYAFSPDSRYAYVVSNDGAGVGNAQVLRVDLATLSAATSIDVGLTSDLPTGVAVSPDGRLLAVTFGGRGVVLHDLTSGATSRVAISGSENADETPVFSGDGATLFVSTGVAIHVIDVAGASVRTTVDFSTQGGLNCVVELPRFGGHLVWAR